MNQFIRNNPTLVFGLGLPLLLVLVFALASGIPNLTGTPPRYDVIFATNYNPGTNGIRIEVKDKKARVIYVGERNYYSIPKLYILSPASGSVREIPLTMPAGFVYKNATGAEPDSGKITPLSVPELEKLTLDNSSIAPDGFEFSPYDTYSHGGLMGELFFARGYHNGAMLKKGAYRLKIPNADNVYFGNSQFIGWVVPQ